jgi:hypothetical protein
MKIDVVLFGDVKVFFYRLFRHIFQGLAKSKRLFSFFCTTDNFLESNHLNFPIFDKIFFQYSLHLF